MLNGSSQLVANVGAIGFLRIAQRLSAGNHAPRNRKSRRDERSLRTATLFCRPSETGLFFHRKPSTEVPGYARKIEGPATG